jgi:VCBS repeat-containing protein
MFARKRRARTGLFSTIRSNEGKKALAPRPLRCESLEERHLLSVDLSVTGLFWDTLRDAAPTVGWRGVDVHYEVTGGSLATEPQAGFYWASGPTRQDVIGDALSAETLGAAEGFHLLNNPAMWGNVPTGAKYLLFVADPLNQVQEADETNNVRALAIHTAQEILSGAFTFQKVDDYTVRAEFKPGGGAYTISEAEVVLGVDHFNWVNQVYMPQSLSVRQGSGTTERVLDGSPLIFPATTATDLAGLRLVSATASPAAEPFGSILVDRLPFYWNEPWTLPDPMPMDVRGQTTSQRLVFEDSPRVPAGFLAAGESLQFYTQCVGVTAAGDVVTLPGVPLLAWTSNTAFADRASGDVYLATQPGMTLPAATSGGVANLALVDAILPFARDDVARLPQDTSLAVDVLRNDGDPTSGAVRIVAVGTPMFGTATLDDRGTTDPGDDRILYTPMAGYSGFDTFQYSVVRRNGAPGIATAKVVINVASPIVGLGVAGDDLSDEYVQESYSYGRSWMQLLVGMKGIPAGAYGTYAEPRRQGYEYNWARSGESSLTLLIDGQTDGLGNQVSQGKVNYTVLAVGENDFVLLGEAYDKIYGNQWTQGQIDAYVGSVADIIVSSLASLVATGANVVLVNVPDPGLAPLAKEPEFYPDAAGRQRVATAIEALNARLEQMSILYNVPLVDLYKFEKSLFGTHQAPIASQTIGGVVIQNTDGVARTNAFVEDGMHLNTVPQGLIANLIVEAIQQGYGTNVTSYRLSERDVVVAAGLTYGGQDTFALKYADYVVLPTANRLPTAGADQYAIDEDGTLRVPAASGLLVNDADANVNPLAAVVATAPAHGTLTLLADGSFRYVPAANFNGQDTFTYKVHDGLGYSEAAVVTINVRPVNDAPTAAGGPFATYEDAAIDISLSLNDGDPEVSQQLTFTLVSGPAHGTLGAFDPATGKITYTPATNYNGPDSFQFKITDDDKAGAPANLSSAVLTVNLNVERVNDVPTASEATATIDENGSVIISLTGDDGDPEVVQKLVYVHGQAPREGTLSIDRETGKATYTPNPGYFGNDSFGFTVTDDETAGYPTGLTSTEGRVQITIRPVNDAPTATSQIQYVTAGTSCQLQLAGNDGDPYIDQKLTYQIAAAPKHGTISGFDPATGALVYTPEAGFNGAETFTFTVTDDAQAGAPASLVSAPATVTLRVARPLGDLEFAAVDNENPSTGERWYSLAPTHRGWLTVQASVPTADAAFLGLYQGDMQIATSQPFENKPRIDYAIGYNPYPGDLYYVRLSGGATDADLRFLNLVQTSAAAVSVNSSSAADTFRFSGATGRVTVNDVVYVVDPGTLKNVQFNGNLAASDALYLEGTAAAEKLLVQANTATLSGGSVQVVASDLQLVIAEGGGADTLEVRCSAQTAESLRASEDVTIFTGGPTIVRGNHFPKVIAYGSADDSAELRGSARGGEHLTIQPDKGILDGGVFRLETYGFGRISAFSEGGDDEALFTASPTEKDYFTFNATTRIAGLANGSNSYAHLATGFNRVTSQATPGGDDTAILTDSAGDDAFEANSAFVTLTNGVYSFRGDNFACIVANATQGNDTARLHGSTDSENFISAMNFAILTSAWWTSRANGFDLVEADAGNSTNDAARLYDAASDDTLTVNVGDVKLTGGGYANRAVGFTTTQAYATVGNDQARFYDSTGDDHLSITPTIAAMYSGAAVNIASNFASVYGYRVTGQGSDVATLEGSAGNDTFDSYQDAPGIGSYATLAGRANNRNFLQRVENFLAVSARSGGGQDTATLRGTAAVDAVLASPSLVQITHGDVTHSATQFSSVYLLTEGGADTASVMDSAAADRLEAAVDWLRMNYGDRSIYISGLSELAQVMAGLHANDEVREQAHDYALTLLMLH